MPREKEPPNISELEYELFKLKSSRVGLFKNPEAMAYHQEQYHKVYRALEQAKKALSS